MYIYIYIIYIYVILLLSMLLKKLTGQDVQKGILWILQLNHFEKLERLIGCINYEQFFHMVLMVLMTG